MTAFITPYGGGAVGPASMRPGLAAAEGEIVGIGDRTAHRFLWLDHLVGDALALAIGDRLFLAVEVQRDLLLHVAGRGPAHQWLDRARLLGYEVVSFVSIQLGSQAQPVLEAFESSIAAIPRIQQCWRISGDTDYLLKCVAPSVESMRQQLLHFAAMPNVKNLRSFPVLGVAKDVPLPLQEIAAVSAG